MRETHWQVCSPSAASDVDSTVAALLHTIFFFRVHGPVSLLLFCSTLFSSPKVRPIEQHSTSIDVDYVSER